MVLIKILGAIDVVAGIIFLMLIFGMNAPFQILLFFAGLLLLKGMFIITGDVLSLIDLASSLLFFISIFFSLPALLLWIPAFILFAKGFVSFI